MAHTELKVLRERRAIEDMLNAKMRCAQDRSRDRQASPRRVLSRDQAQSTTTIMELPYLNGYYGYVLHAFGVFTKGVLDDAS